MTQATRRSLLTAAASAAAAASWTAPARAETTVEAPAGLAELIRAERARILHAIDQEGLEGAGVCLLHDGAPVWVEGFGVTDRASGRPVGTDTIFSIQSTSKNFTAVAVMLAVQEGLLDLDQPITAYLPDFTVHSRFEPEPQKRMTLRLLLSHRAGFTHEAPVGNNYEPAFPSFEAHVRSISDTWLRYPVGERYRYSNLGHDLAGYLLQIRCGMPFAEWVRTRLFEPLGMKDSTFDTDTYVARQNRAVGHDEGHTSVPLRTPLIPSGGVYTSARDMAAYARFHLERGRAGDRVVLRPELWREMHGFGLGGDYSLGVIREELRYGSTPVRLLSHKGGGFGFGSVFDYCPEAGLAWAAIFNRPIDAAYRFGAALVDGALALRYGPRRPRIASDSLAPIELPARQARAWTGTYVGRNATASVEPAAQGGLVLRQGKAASPLRFTAPDQAFTVDPGGEVIAYRCLPARGDEPAHLECWVGEISLDRSEGPDDPPGPDRPQWARLLGRYRVDQWGVPAEKVLIDRSNGWLRLNGARLVVEHEPGLFFTADGEAVDFRSSQPTWKNLRLQRI